MPTRFNRVYIESAAYYLPGKPINNQEMDDYIAPINRISARIKKKILEENGITARYYAIDSEGNTHTTHAQLAANAIRCCLKNADESLDNISLLTMGSTGSDALIPGFANMVQGELGAQPMETLSSLGVCAAGITAISYAAQSIELGAHSKALVAAAEMPSRIFKRSRFAPRGYTSDFDAHFLRWMLSDGAGAFLLTNNPSAKRKTRLKINWVHQKSFAGDYPVCMQLGLTEDRSKSFLDFPSSSDAEAAGALALRQDIRLLPHLFDVSIHEYVKLVNEGWINSSEIDHFLCHYSSARFIPVVEDLLEKAGLTIPRERWYSNLAERGNTGSASIFIMLAEFLETRDVKVGEKIFCFIPESGRMTAAYMLIEVEDASLPTNASMVMPLSQNPVTQSPAIQESSYIEASHNPSKSPQHLQSLLTSLAQVWHDYRSQVWRSPIIHKLVSQKFTQADYQLWTSQWVPQVREGSKWMREAVGSLTKAYKDLAALIELHASDEQHDFMILYQDYCAAGGTLALDNLQRNPGGDALNSYLHSLAATKDPVGLLGAIYVIEGTGQRIIPALLPLLRKQLDLPANAFRFLDYHGANDEHHLARWLNAVELVLAKDAQAANAIVATAKRTAQLYLMQFDHILEI
jgi:3-oxoacyl-[acyl-carrier-protein] synthase III